MSVQNTSLFDPSIIDLSDFEMDTRVSFDISAGEHKLLKLGNRNTGYHVTERPYCLTTYDISFTALKKTDADLLRERVNALVGSRKYVPFNDFSDNYVLNWSREGVQQFGMLVRLPALTNSYQLCKVYAAGDKYSIRPIHYVPADAEIEFISGLPILNRNTGVVTSSDDLQFTRFELDFYYTLVRLSSEVTIRARYPEGYNTVIDSDYPEEAVQLFDLSFTLTEVRLNQPLEYNNHLDDTSNAFVPLELLKYDLCGHINDLVETIDRQRSVFEHNLFHAVDSDPNGVNCSKITVPSRITKHERLIYDMTMFKACSGASFELDI